MRDEQTLIRITKETYNKIKLLADRNGHSYITTLEYLLNGKIDLSELK